MKASWIDIEQNDLCKECIIPCEICRKLSQDTTYGWEVSSVPLLLSLCLTWTPKEDHIFLYLCLPNSWTFWGAFGRIGWLVSWLVLSLASALSVTRKRKLEYQVFFSSSLILCHILKKKKQMQLTPWTSYFDIKYMNVHTKDEHCSSFIASVPVILKGYIYAGSEILFTGNTHVASLILKEYWSPEWVAGPFVTPKKNNLPLTFVSSLLLSRPLFLIFQLYQCRLIFFWVQQKKNSLMPTAL